MNNKTKVRVLKKARRIIAKDKEQYVCLALATVANDYPSLREASEQLQKYVQLALGAYYTLDAWIVYNRKKLPRNERLMSTYRLQWIDWMIASLEGKN